MRLIQWLCLDRIVSRMRISDDRHHRVYLLVFGLVFHPHFGFFRFVVTFIDGLGTGFYFLGTDLYLLGSGLNRLGLILGGNGVVSGDVGFPLIETGIIERAFMDFGFFSGVCLESEIDKSYIFCFGIVFIITFFLLAK